MSRVVKMGFLTGLDSLLDFEEYGQIDAIITATNLGCIADSEKFLTNIIEGNERMINPTPFINSTFNTVGAQIALIRSLHCYNNTFTNRYTSFEAALLDAMLRISTGNATAVLVGAFDEATSTVNTIMTRLGLLRNRVLGEGAIFFVLSANQLESSVAEIQELNFGIDKTDSLPLSEVTNELWSGMMAQAMIHSIQLKRSGYIKNDIASKNN